jgi:hypothetical protein
MKRITLLIMFLTLIASGLHAQDKGKNDWQDRWKAEKIAFLTDAIDLTSAEAEKFWPVYNKCESEKRSCFIAVMDAYKALEDAINAGKDESELHILLDKYIESQEYGKDIEKKYVEEYRKILSDKKVAKLYIAEESFRRQQIHRLHKNDNKGDKR